jgi:hypothetical protein
MPNLLNSYIIFSHNYHFKYAPVCQISRVRTNFNTYSNFLFSQSVSIQPCETLRFCFFFIVLFYVCYLPHEISFGYLSVLLKQICSDLADCTQSGRFILQNVSPCPRVLLYPQVCFYFGTAPETAHPQFLSIKKDFVSVYPSLRDDILNELSSSQFAMPQHIITWCRKVCEFIFREC